jgi:hypothetical protein
MRDARNVAEEPNLGHLFSRHSGGSAETSKAATLHLTECAASTDKCDRADSGHSGENLKQVPRGIVEEEDSLEGDQRSEEYSVRKRGGLESSGKVADVSTEKEPLER